MGTFIARRLAGEEEKIICFRQKGSNLQALADLGDRITWREANVLDPVSLFESLGGVETVIHAAALVSFNPARTQEILDVNVNGTRHVVDACLASGVKKLVHISSIAALGRPKGMTVIDETSRWLEGHDESCYAESKYLAELEIFRGHEEGLHVSIVNPSVILAPGDWSRSSSRIFRYVWKENPFYTDGLLNYVDARDVVEIVTKLVHGDFNGERFIASAGSVSLFDFLAAVAKKFGKRPPGVKVGTFLTALVASLESIRSRALGLEPMVTRQTVRLAKEKFTYDHSKAATRLGIRFRKLEETLDWCCPHYLGLNTTNK